MTILVTGGAGFIGSNFIRYLLDETSHKVINLDLLTYAGNPDNLKDVSDSDRYTFIHGDIGDYPLVSSLLRTYMPNAIVNFAAHSHVDRSISDPKPFITTNVLGTFTLLEAAKEYMPHRRNKQTEERFRFLHISTDEVYGSLGKDDAPFTENTPYAPNSPYSASKAAADHLVRSYHHTFALPTLITNCSNNYGPYQFPEKLIPLMIDKALAQQPLPVYGDGGSVRDWIYVRDHCAGIAAVLERGIPGQQYNLGGENEYTNIDLVRTLCAVLDEMHPRANGESYAQLISFVTDRPGHDRRYAVDNTRIRSELGWKPQESFTSGLRKTVRWYLDNRQWLRDIETGAYRNLPPAA